MKRRTALLGLSLNFLWLLLGACDKTPDTFTIGALLPLTGDAASYGTSARQGIDLAVDQINASGGISGRQVRVVYEDSKAAAREGVAATQKLINVDRVPAIIGDITSGVTLAAAPIAERSQVVLISPTASAPDISAAGIYVFRNFPSDNFEGEAMAEFIHNRGIRRVAILQVQNEYGEGIATVFDKTFRARGGAVLARERYPQDASQFRTILTKVHNQEPEALYIVGYYKDAALALRQARELRIKTPAFATTTVEDPQFVQIGGSAVEGVVYPLASGFDISSSDSLVANFSTAFKSKYQSDPGFVAAQAYDCVLLVKRAVENSNGFTGPDIQRGMADIRDFHGVAGLTTFDPNGDIKRGLRMRVVQKGAFQNLADSLPAADAKAVVR